eukprot:Nk52_evm2s2356 gene=Nk52_evmTU2s2356
MTALGCVNESVDGSKAANEHTAFPCYVCNKDIGNLSESGRNMHLNSCLDSEKNKKTDVNSGSTGFSCFVCKKDISHLSEKRREQHLNVCLDDQCAAEIYQNNKEKYDAQRQTYTCPLCRKTLDVTNTFSRSKHYEACAKKKKIPLDELVDELKSHREKENALPLKQILVNYGKEHREQIKLRKGAVDEDLQMALAVSRAEEDLRPKKSKDSEKIPSILKGMSASEVVRERVRAGSSGNKSPALSQRTSRSNSSGVNPNVVRRRRYIPEAEESPRTASIWSISSLGSKDEDITTVLNSKCSTPLVDAFSKKEASISNSYKKKKAKIRKESFTESDSSQSCVNTSDTLSTGVGTGTGTPCLFEASFESCKTNLPEQLKDKCNIVTKVAEEIRCKVQAKFDEELKSLMKSLEEKKKNQINALASIWQSRLRMLSSDPDAEVNTYFLKPFYDLPISFSGTSSSQKIPPKQRTSAESFATPCVPIIKPSALCSTIPHMPVKPNAGSSLVANRAIDFGNTSDSPAFKTPLRKDVRLVPEPSSHVSSPFEQDTIIEIVAETVQSGIIDLSNTTPGSAMSSTSLANRDVRPNDFDASQIDIRNVDSLFLRTLSESELRQLGEKYAVYSSMFRDEIINELLDIQAQFLREDQSIDQVDNIQFQGEVELIQSNSEYHEGMTLEEEGIEELSDDSDLPPINSNDNGNEEVLCPPPILCNEASGEFIKARDDEDEEASQPFEANEVQDYSEVPNSDTQTQMTNFIKKEKEIYEQMLSYKTFEPEEISELLLKMKDAGIKCSKDMLNSFLDSMSVTVRAPGAKLLKGGGYTIRFDIGEASMSEAELGKKEEASGVSLSEVIIETEEVSGNPLMKGNLEKGGDRIYLGFRNINYYVKQKNGKNDSKQKQILENVSGVVRPGHPLAILGPSGAGKTSLLNILSNRTTQGKLEGLVTINGKSDPSFLLHDSGYVTQEDSLIAFLTVYETLMYAAHFKLGSLLSNEEKKKRIEEVIREVNMEKSESSMVGGSFFGGGLSGGERKRLSIAIELLIEPQLLFLDEPTSGLDSNMSQEVMQFISKIAANEQRTTLYTIHQPRANVFTSFDQLMLLWEGRTIYFGSRDKVMDWFLRQGFECDYQTNPADFLLDVICKDTEKSQSLCDAYEKSPENTDILKELDELEKNARESYFNMHKEIRIFFNSFFWQVYVLMKREFLLSFRVPLIWAALIMQALLMGGIMGSLYSQLDQNKEQDQLKALYFVTFYLALMGFSSTPYLIEFRKIFYAETASGRYTSMSYMFTKSVVDFPLFAVAGVTFSTIMFVCLQFDWDHYTFFLLNTMATVTSGCSVIVFIASISPDMSTSLIFITFIQGLTLMFAGFFGKYHATRYPTLLLPFVLILIFYLNSSLKVFCYNIPVFWKWAYYMSYANYSFSGFVVNEFEDNPLVLRMIFGNNATIPDKWDCLYVLIGTATIFRLLACACLHFKVCTYFKK